ncbi:MAG: hypothetical protein JKY25_06845 [Robiginitomaculum sp.]|nr:hypothetical protein [Robiginitomaculum sp.]
MKHICQYFWVFLACIFAVPAQALPTHDYFPKDVSFSADTTLPEAYLGYEIGDWHISPDALTGYMRALAAESPRVSIETIGYSHERKALTHVYISSPANITNLDAVLAQHQNAKSAKDDVLVINLAYSVHGNEASGSNAAPLVAYYLAASQEKWVEEFLAKTVVIIEPVQNPDGLARFAVWANQHKGATENFDNANRDHNESWPSGRTNHYWFDLNRDWIFTVHPESKARIKAYQKWKPHVLGDYHEMGGNTKSYFFQPGHPKRTHPLTSKTNQKITLDLARHHAKALDARAQPYYTEERFDDFYYGKGSTYPDATGAIGLLFEQTSVRGHARELGGENIRFSDGIANQLATSLSLLRGSDAERDEILAYRFRNRAAATNAARANPVKAYIFADDNDPARAQKLLDILRRHNIPAYSLTNDIFADGQTFKRNQAYVVKLADPQYALIASLFDTRTTFDDNVFYDVSTWNLPLALNLPYAPLKNLIGVNSEPMQATAKPIPKNWGDERPVAYAFEWNQLRAPHLLQTLTASKLYPRVSVKPFSSDTLTAKSVAKSRDFAAGTIVVQPTTAQGRQTLMAVLETYPGVKVYGLSTGLTSRGPDLGSRDMKVLAQVKPALLVGSGVSPTEAGAIRYAVDNRFGMPLTILDMDRLGGTDLTEYTHFLLADGDYKTRKSSVKSLKAWVKSGGIIIAQKRAATWLEDSIIFADAKKDKGNAEDAEGGEPVRRAYQGYEQDSGKRRISGAILRANADLTHPLMFGYNREALPVFYNARKALAPPPISYDTPLAFAKKDVLITGYGDKKQLEKLEATPVIALHRMGKGKIVLMNSDVNFRAIWFGTEKLYANALFFTQALDARIDEKPKSKARRDEE